MSGNNEDVNDYGKKSTYCKTCNKKTISTEEISCFKCPECNNIK